MHALKIQLSCQANDIIIIIMNVATKNITPVICSIIIIPMHF